MRESTELVLEYGLRNPLPVGYKGVTISMRTTCKKSILQRLYDKVYYH